MITCPHQIGMWGEVWFGEGGTWGGCFDLRVDPNQIHFQQYDANFIIYSISIFFIPYITLYIFFFSLFWNLLSHFFSFTFFPIYQLFSVKKYSKLIKRFVVLFLKSLRVGILCVLTSGIPIMINDWKACFDPILG